MALHGDDNKEGSKGNRFLPIHIDSLDPQSLEMDLWIRPRGQAVAALYRAKGVEISVDDISRLREQKVNFLYIAAGEHAVYRKALTKKLDTVFQDRSRAEMERARIIRANCTQMIDDVLLLPGQAEPIDAVADISRTFAAWVAADADQFGYLLDMAAHDFYTSAHMVNVGVGCGLLFRKLRPDEPHLFSLGVQGGLLHDIGKRGIPEAILNKAGKLNDAEWEVVRSHPTRGYEELSKHAGVPEMVLEMARDHHERLDGKGYAKGLSEPSLSLAARVCAVVDVFDAVTSARSYKGATHPLDVLDLMKRSVHTHFDPVVFDAWRELVEQLLDKDPNRVGELKLGENIVPLEEFLIVEAPHKGGGPQADVVASGKSGGLSGSERRVHSRFDCKFGARAKFLRQIKPFPGVGVGQDFNIKVIDVSRGGVCLETSSPMARGDLIELHLPARDGKTVQRYGQVVRVRSRQDGVWINGICFVENVAAAA